MSASPQSPMSDVTIELSERPQICVVSGCAGIVVRHSLGAGQGVDRCTRCFRRYSVRAAAAAPGVEKGRIRRFLDDLVAWRD